MKPVDHDSSRAEGRTLSVRIVEARRENRGTLVFLSGFPDTHNVFLDTLVPGLSEDHRCVVACLPDFDQPKLAAPFGYSTRAVVAMLDRTIATFAPGEPVTLVLHDWGSIYGLAWFAEHPTKVERLVCLDVFAHDVVRTAWAQSKRELVWVLVYQGWLAAAFLVGRVVPLAGDLVLFALGVSGLGPDLAPPSSRVFAPPRGPRWFMGYPYVRTWIERLVGRGIAGEPSTTVCPILFAYGTKKRVRFHSSAQVDALARNPRHRVIAYACGHWVQHAKAAELTEEIRHFVARPSHGP